MMRQPAFWQHGRGGMIGLVLWPAAAVTARVTARRIARPGFAAPVPVICCGNATVGGAGKTTLAIDLAKRITARGIAVHVLTRGYGGASRGLVRVDPARHEPAEVGDEALLLAAVAPTWLCADRAAGARAAVAAGAQLLLMDDGMQNPGLAKTLSLLVVDGPSGFGNGRVLPAGPLREPVAACAARAGAVVLIGEDRTGVRGQLPADLPVLTARLQPDASIATLRGRRVLAFAGVAQPPKFFRMLTEAGVKLAGTRVFADHHPYQEKDIARLVGQAAALHATLVTTPKDHVRLPDAHRREVVAVGVSLVWDEPAALEVLLSRVCV